MNASYIIGEILIELSPEEIKILENGSSLEGKIFVYSEERKPYAKPLRLYVTDGPYWIGRVLPEDPRKEIRLYEVGFPPEGLPVLKEKETIHADFIEPKVNFRKIRVRREDAPF